MGLLYRCLGLGQRAGVARHVALPARDEDIPYRHVAEHVGTEDRGVRDADQPCFDLVVATSRNSGDGEGPRLGHARGKVEAMVGVIVTGQDGRRVALDNSRLETGWLRAAVEED